LDFWCFCYGGDHSDFYFNGFAPDVDRRNGADLLPDGDRRRLRQCVHHFFDDFGLNINRREDVERYEAEIHPPLLAWLDALEKWASDWNLDGRMPGCELKKGWMMHWAFLKLDSYADREEKAGEDRTYRLSSPPLPDIFGEEIQPPETHKPYIHELGLDEFRMSAFEVRLDSWRPLVQSREDFEGRAREDFELALKRYLNDCERRLGSNPDLKHIWGKTELAHYKWLAEYQCANATINGLANEAGRSRPTVQQAIEEVAEFIGLPLRSPNPIGKH
jgi:hypothetical protein